MRVHDRQTFQEILRLDRALAFVDPLFARPALIVAGDDPLGWARQVGDDETDARIKLAGNARGGAVARRRRAPRHLEIRAFAHASWNPAKAAGSQAIDNAGRSGRI